MTYGARFILHADMDAFYASVEQRDNPELRGKPVIIGARGARGVVSAASYEARKFGVRSAMPGFKAHELCPQGVFLDGDMKKYARVSDQVHRVFEEFSDMIEPLALDEAFIDITGSLQLFGSTRALGQRLKDRVREEVNLVVSVGVAPNKLLAKMACSAGKPDGLFVLEPPDIAAFLAPRPARALFGIGPKTAELLTTQGIHTLRDLAEAPAAQLALIFGDHSEQMRARAQGFDERPVESHRDAKSIGEEATFADNVTDERRITSAIISHSEEVAARARRSHYRGATITLKIKLARRKTWGDKAVANHELFPLITRQITLKEPTCDGKVISHEAIELFKKLKLREGVRLVGVSLSSLRTEQAPKQLDLFSRPVARNEHLPQKPHEVAIQSSLSHTRGEQLGAALDQITARFGDDAVVRGGKRVEKITATDRIKLGERGPREPK